MGPRVIRVVTVVLMVQVVSVFKVAKVVNVFNVVKVVKVVRAGGQIGSYAFRKYMPLIIIKLRKAEISCPWTDRHTDVKWKVGQEYTLLRIHNTFN